MDIYKCNQCGHEVLSHDKPEPIKWSDGHVCYFQNLQCNICGKKLKFPSECNQYGECWECVEDQDNAEYSDDIYYTDY